MTWIDDEKIPTTDVESLTVGGVHVWSRYQKLHELVLMTSVVLALPAATRSAVKSLWCDSKANSVFSVEMQPGYDEARVTRPLAAQISELLRKQIGGHNGVFVGQTAAVDPDWDERLE